MGPDQEICEDLGELVDLVIVSCTDLVGEDVLGPTPVGNGETFTINGDGFMEFLLHHLAVLAEFLKNVSQASLFSRHKRPCSECLIMIE